MKLPLKNTPAIAVVLTDRDVHTAEKEEILEADLVELRVDLFEDIENIEDTFKLAKIKFNLPILTTVRIPSEGGRIEFSDREEIFKKILHYSDFADVEILSKDVTSIKKAIREHGKVLITSYHRFDLTPSVEELENIFKKGKELGGDIIKIATMVKSSSDLESLLLFTLKHRKDNIIIIGMGEEGTPSRIINPIFGSLITYASFIDSSAPGQIQLKDLIKILKILRIR